MREYKVNVTNAPNRYVLIGAESAPEAEELARRDGYDVFGETVLWSCAEDNNEFEGMMPRQLRQLCRTLQDDLRKAVTDRAALMTAMKSIARQAGHGLSGLESVQLLAILRNIEVTALNTVSEVEGKG